MLKTDKVMPMCDLIECRNNYSKTSRSLWQYCRDELSLNNNDNVVDFTCVSHKSKSFEYKQK